MNTRERIKNTCPGSAAHTVFQSSADYLGYQLSSILISVAYGTILSSLPLTVFKDRLNYLKYAEHSLDLLSGYWSNGPVVALANEPVWLLMNYGLSLFLTPENVLRVIIFVPATTTAWLVLRQSPKHFVWLLVFLLMPQVLKSHILHLRQGVASAVFLMGWLSRQQTIRLGLIAITPFIHASFFIVLPLLAMSRMANRFQLSADLRAALFTGIGLCMGVGVLNWASQAMGARQAGVYLFEMKAVSGLGFVFWLFVLIVMGLQGGDFIRRHTFELGTIVFYLSTFFFIEVAARIFKSTMIPVLLAGLSLTDWRRQAFITLIVCFGAFQYALAFYHSWSGFFP